MDYKVKKAVSKQPTIWGLRLTHFVIFIGIVIICMLTLTSRLTIKKIMIELGLIVVSYLVLKFLSQRNIVSILFSDKYPELLKNEK